MTEDLVSAGKWSDPGFIRSIRLNKIKILFNLGEPKCRVFPNKFHADASAQIPIPPASKRTLLTQHQ